MESVTSELFKLITMIVIGLFMFFFCHLSPPASLQRSLSDHWHSFLSRRLFSMSCLTGDFKRDTATGLALLFFFFFLYQEWGTRRTYKRSAKGVAWIDISSYSGKLSAASSLLAGKAAIGAHVQRKASTACLIVLIWSIKDFCVVE